MTVKESVRYEQGAASSKISLDRLRSNYETFPWWILGMVLIFIATVIMIFTQADYQEAFSFISAGVVVTIRTTLFAFGIALILGLITGLARISNSVLLKNIGTLYVEFIRGIPMMVLIFFIAFVGVPWMISFFQVLASWMASLGAAGLSEKLASINTQSISMDMRAIIALSVTYGAFLAEIFRAGIQSIGRGQMEAARAQGMSYWQAMRFIILPQAIRNVLPALGNDFVSMLKDSSLVSVLAVRDITQIAKLYSGRSFHYQEAYIVLAMLYLSMTVILSFLVKLLEKRYQKNERS